MNLRAPRRSSRLSLTPLIDVVFLLLVFFMLAARFGVDGGLEITLGDGGQSYQGPPRLVSVTPDGVRLNGGDIPLEGLADQLAALVAAPSDIVVLQPLEGVPVQALIDVMAELRERGFENLAVVQ